MLEVRRLAAEEARKPFDLREDMMVRASVVKLSYDENVLFLTMHHIASDGWSMGVFSKELGHLYRAFMEGVARSVTALAYPVCRFCPLATVSVQ